MQEEGPLGLSPKDNDKADMSSAAPHTDPADDDTAPAAQPSLAPAPSAASSARPADVSQIDGPDVTRAASKETPLKDTFQVRPRVSVNRRDVHMNPVPNLVTLF